MRIWVNDLYHRQWRVARFRDGNVLGDFPGLLDDLPFAAAGSPFVPVYPLPNVEGAFGLAALWDGAHPVYPCTSLWTGVLDLMWDNGRFFLLGSGMV